MKLTKLEKWLIGILISVLVAGFNLGVQYQSIDSRVLALENETIRDNEWQKQLMEMLIEVKENVSYIKGKIGD